MSNSSSTLATKTILVIESQELVRTIIVDILRNIGLKNIQTARNGLDGIRQIKTWLPDVVFCDSHPGSITGQQVVHWVRTNADCPNPKVPIIYVTSDRNQDEILSARDVGVSEIIIKPIVPQAVISRLKSVLLHERDFIRSHAFVGPDRRRNRGRTYNGGKRRLNDAPEETTYEIDEGQRDLVLEAIDAILADIPTIDVAARGSVMALYKKSEQLWNLAHETGDHDLDVVTQSLLKYIQAVGASGKLQPELITLHLESTRQLSWHEDQPDRRAILDQLSETIDDALHLPKTA